MEICLPTHETPFQLPYRRLRLFSSFQDDVEKEVDEGLYQFTGGRWLYNEHEQRQARYARFDVAQLASIAGEATGTTFCEFNSRLGNGFYNKTRRLIMGGSLSVVARIPCPVAGPSRLVTASEVTTLQFAREVLKLPVPRVITWNGANRGRTNGVGADYLLMKEAPEVALRKRWLKFTTQKEAEPVLLGLLEVEKRFKSLRFSRIGSIYFNEDVGPELIDVPLSRVLLMTLRCGSRKSILSVRW